MVEARAETFCASCNEPLGGRYCTACGEKTLEPQELTFRHFVTRSIVPELVDLDGRLWRTLRLLFLQPARLTLEYVAGRRMGYIRPVRLLIAAIVIYALATQSGLNLRLWIGYVSLSLAPAPIIERRSLDDVLLQIDRFGIVERLLVAKIGPISTVPDDVRARFMDMLGDFSTPVSFATVFLLALALWLLFRRRRPLLGEHAVFSMHFFSFVLLWSLWSVPFLELGLIDEPAAVLFVLAAVVLWQPVYLTIALRRFYWPADARPLAAWPSAAGVALFVYLLNSVFITAVQLVGGMIAVWRL